MSVNEHGELEVETEFGPVKFTKPIAYQEINGKRVDVSVEYRVESSEAENKSSKHKTCNSKLMSTNPKSSIQNLSSTSIGDHKLEYGFKVASYDKSHDLIIDPLLASTYLGGSGGEFGYSLTLDTSGNVYVTGWTASSDFPTTSGAYDTSNNGSYDVFVSKLDGGLTSLLASTYLGGSDSDYSDYGYSLALDTSGNVYVTGYTDSTDFPTTSGAYDTSYNGSDGASYRGDVFVSKLNSELTSLLASTYLGGNSYDRGYSLSLDTNGNVYVTGYTSSANFPTSGPYDTSYGGASDVFISKLNGGLTYLLGSTFLGGSGSEIGYSLTLDRSGNVYVSGETSSTDFPITSGTYDTSCSNCGSYDSDVFVSKLNSELTGLLASTYLGGTSYDRGYSLFLDTNGNVYATGYTSSTDFPTTSGAYDTSFNGGSYDVFVLKLDGGLTTLLASTYLGGSGSYDYGYSLSLDTNGNVYVTGYTESTDFPTTSGAYDTSFNGGLNDVFVSKLDGGLTTLLSSTYLGGAGYGYDYSYSLVLDTNGNVYVAGKAGSGFPTTSGAYDTSYNGSDVFVSKLDSNLSSSKPTVSTGSATNATSISATFNGTVNANGVSTTVWFQHGTVSGSYGNTSSSQVVSGSSNTTVSISISGLSSNTTYYYRIVALNSGGTSYGSEVSFTTSSAPTPAPTPTDTTAPSGLVSINSSASYTNSTTITLSLSATDNVGVVGYYVSTSSSTPTASASGWNSVTSTTSYSGSDSYTLTSGDETKTVYVWYKDDAGNVSIAASDSIILDTTAPIVTITRPTSTDTYTTTSSPLSLSGSASDGSSGVKEVTWNNDKGGSGTTSGTSYWSASSINLTSGENKITVTAKDNVGNTSTDTIMITYNAGKVPTAITGSATNVTVTAATLTGTVNANGASTTVWFQYGTVSGSYGNTSSSQVVSGSSNTTVSISISSLSSNTTYYYRIVASNSAGTSYGSEASFATKTVSATPIPTTSPAPTLSPVPTPVASPSPAPTLPPLPTPIPTLTPEPNEKGTISGYIVNKKGYPIESAKIRLKGANSKIFNKTFSDEDGFFEFTDLDADTYTITTLKKGYKTVKQTITLEAGEEKDIEIVMKKVIRKGR